MKRRSLFEFRDWLFNLLIDHLVNSDWVIVIKDFKKSEKRDERKNWGMTDYQKEVIYLDKEKGTSRVLVHELCHFGLRTTLEEMSKSLSWGEIKDVKGRHRADKEFEWRELRTKEFEDFFYPSLTKRQIKVLQRFIDEARERHRD